MDRFIEFVTDNVQWVFSGIGVFVLTLFVARRLQRKQKQRVKGNSIGVQAGRDVNIITGTDVSDGPEND